MLRHARFSIVLGFLISCSTSAVNAQVVGDTVNAANTFEDAGLTNAAEVLFQAGSATVVFPGAELSSFAGVYDVDFSDNALSMTLVSNANLQVLQYPAGTFDRYYFGIEGRTVDSISVTGGATALTNGLTVGLLAPGFNLTAPDSFGTGAVAPSYDDGGFFVQFGEGSDYGDGTIGESVTFSLTTTAVPEPSSASLLGVVFAAALLFRRRKG